MEDRIINPKKPQEIIKELFHDNKEILDKFSEQFSKEIIEFAELFSQAYKKIF